MGENGVKQMRLSWFEEVDRLVSFRVRPTDTRCVAT